MAPPKVPPTGEKPVTRIVFEADDVIEVRRPKPKLSPKEAVKRFLKAAEFKPPKKGDEAKVAEAFRGGETPAGNPVYRSPASQPAQPSFATLTPEERGPRTLSVPPVETSPKGETTIASLDQGVINKHCRKVALSGPLGGAYGLRIKPGSPKDVEASLTRRGFIPVAVYNPRGKVVGRVYVQRDVYQRAIAGVRKSTPPGAHVEPRIVMSGKRLVVRPGESFADRATRFNDLHPKGERIDPDTVAVVTTLEIGVAGLKDPIPQRPEPKRPERRPADLGAAKAPRGKGELSDAEARAKLHDLLDERGDIGNCFGGGKQFDFWPKVDGRDVRRIAQFFGYLETKVAYMTTSGWVITKAFVRPEDVGVAQSTISRFTASGAGYARAFKSDIAGTHQLVDNKGHTIGYKVISSEADFAAMLSGYNQIDIGEGMYFVKPGNEGALLAAVNGTHSPKAFGK